MNRSRYPQQIARLACGAVALVVLAACGSAPDPDPEPGAGTSSAAPKEFTIGFSPITLSAPALQGLAKGLEGYAASQGLKVVVADPKANPQTQQQQLAGWVARDEVQAIWVLPVAAPALTGVIKQAQAKGIAVLLSGVPKDYGLDGMQKGITFSITDNTAYGSSLAEMLTDCINSKLGGKATIISVTDPIQGTAPRAIQDALAAGIAKGSPNAKLVTVSGGDRLKSQQVTASSLQANPDATALVGTNDELTLGGLGAFEQAGKKASDICAVGAGGGEEAMAAVTSGKLVGEVAFDFQKDLVQNVTELQSLVADPSATGKQLTIPINVVKGQG